jgi:hypothetical protein
MTSYAVALGIATSALSILTFCGGLVAYFKASARKEYASERDINHLKNSVDQLSRNVETLWQQSDRRFDFVDLKLTELAIRNSNQKTRAEKEGHRLGKNSVD